MLIITLHISTMMSSWVIELITVFFTSRFLLSRTIPVNSIDELILNPVTVKCFLYYNRTAHSLNEFGQYKVNRRIVIGYK